MTILVVGSHSESGLNEIYQAAATAGEAARVVPSVAELPDAIEEQPPRCIVADSQVDLAAINRVLYGRTDCFGVAVIAVAPELSNAIWTELHYRGADDVVPEHDVPALTRRLAALSHFDPGARASLSSGTSLIAHANLDRRQLLGRVLRQAGFDVVFAATEGEACRLAELSPPKVLLMAEELPPSGGRAALEKLAKHWVGEMPALLLGGSSRHASREAGGYLRVGNDAPPDDLVFMVNELLRPRELLEARASRRVLYATLCSFRAAGQREASAGLTYNVSREGLYVRTLDAPANGSDVWLEMQPIEQAGLCHLRGCVVWVRGLATGARGAAPPGFGVKLQPERCPPDDLRAYREGYRKLAELSAI